MLIIGDMNLVIFLYQKLTTRVFFFVLLQKVLHYRDDDGNFTIKLGKYRFLDGEFKLSCQKVLVYLAESNTFILDDVKLKEKSDGTKYFDAISYLDSFGLKYVVNDTEHYRYFKSRLHDIRSEIILNEETQRVGFIHRRINADDYERVQFYPYRVSDTPDKTLSIAEKGFYFFTWTDDNSMSYHELVYCRTEEEMTNYLKSEYEATDGKELIAYPMKNLLEGVEYQQSYRQGCRTSKVHCQMFHETLGNLYTILDKARLLDENGKRIKLSDYLITAKNETDIQEVVDAYNECWENQW